MDLTYRRGEAQDAALFVSLEARVEDPRLYGPTLDLVTASREIVGNRFFFAYKDGVPIGTVAYRYVEDGGAYISNVAIVPEHQGKGVARVVMSHFLSECRDAPYSFLVTYPENTRALALYGSLGFSVRDRRENYFRDGQPRLSLIRPGRSST